MASPKKTLHPERQAELLATLKSRFDKNTHRHKGQDWPKIEALLLKNPGKLAILFEMENTGGEPDLVVFEDDSSKLYYVDCCAESPPKRRSCCYDRKGQLSRKEHQPERNAVDWAAEIGVSILTESQYRNLQRLEKFDLKTSSWIDTPENIRKLGGALFCDRRYDTVFTYHNGAQSYYAARAFRAALEI